MRNKKYWRIGLIVLIVGLLAFGGAVAGLASDPFGPILLTNADFDSGDFGTPDPSCEWLVGEYEFPEDCDLKGVKINDPETGSFEDQFDPEDPEKIEFGCGATDFDVDITIVDPGNTFNFTTSYTVYYVWVKAGPNGYLYGYPDGTQSEMGLISPAADSISHITFYFCDEDPSEELTVTKTAVTSYTREHFWDIEKEVETEEGHELDDVAKIWLYIDGSGDETATWTVDVTYEDYEDRDWNVSGTITIENTGDLDAVITEVVDELCEEEIEIVWVDGAGDPLDPQPVFPYTLEVGETLTGVYSVDLDEAIEDCNNEVTVYTEENDDPGYFATEPVVWGDPDEEINETVNIKDISNLFGEEDLGTVTAPNDDQFTYTNDFAWEDYGADNCGSYQYDNTATIVETEQSASATLKVNVQCYVYDTAYAKSDDAECFIPTFSNWGWTNPALPGEYTWDLWAGAGQCDTSKGTLVGSVTVAYDGGGYVTVTFNVDAPYILEETHVYADYDMFPQIRQGRRGWVDTVAPGQYYNDSPFDGSEVYVIAHAVVGIPDPDFGPDPVE